MYFILQTLFDHPVYPTPLNRSNERNVYDILESHTVSNIALQILENLHYNYDDPSFVLYREYFVTYRRAWLKS